MFTQSAAKEEQWTRLDAAARSVAEQRAQVSDLESQLQAKNSELKNLRSEADSFVAKSEKAQSDIYEFTTAIDSLRTSMEILTMETSRTKSQILQAKNEVAKVKNAQKDTSEAVQKVRDQILNTQSFIDKLKHEEERRGQELISFGNENNSIDEVIGDLSNVADLTRAKIRELKQLKEKLELESKTKHFEN